MSGGLQNYIFRTAQRLHAAGEVVTVISRTETQPQAYDFPVRHIRSRYWKQKLLGIVNRLTQHKFESVLNMLLDAHLYSQECKKIHDADIIQSPNYKYMGLFVKHKNAKLVVRASSYRPLWTEETNPLINTHLMSFLENKLYKKADRVFAPSRHMASILEKELKINVDFLPTPIPDTVIDEDNSWHEQHLDGKKYILFFGTILKRKGLFVLAEAMNLVWARDPSVLLVLAGPDLVVDGRSNFEKMMQIIGSHKDKVIYTPNLNQQKLFPVIRNAWFTVLPSLDDNCPNSMLEAMALGKVVLGTFGSSMDEFYPLDAQELLVPRANAAELAKKILWLWDLPEEQINRFGDTCRSHIQQKHSLIGAITALRDYYARI